MIDNFKALDKLKNIGSGAIICMYDKVIDLDEKNKVIPFWYI